MIRDSDGRAASEADRANFLRFDSGKMGPGSYPLTDEEGEPYAVVGGYRVRPIEQATHPRYRFPVAYAFWFHRGEIVERAESLIIPRRHAEEFGADAERAACSDERRANRQEDRRFEVVMPNVNFDQGGGFQRWKLA